MATFTPDYEKVLFTATALKNTFVLCKGDEEYEVPVAEGETIEVIEDLGSDRGLVANGRSFRHGWLFDRKDVA